MVVYVYVEPDGFVSGWSSSEQEGTYLIENPPEGFITSFPQYKYVEGELILDQSKVLSQSKIEMIQSIKERAEQENRVKIILNEESYYFVNNASNKSFLQKSFSLMSDGLIKTTMFNLLNQDEEEVVIELNKNNVHELWLLTFLKEEDTNKELKTNIEFVESIQTIEELEAYQNKVFKD